MTFYDILVPVLFLSVGVAGVLIVHLTDPDRKQPRKR